LWRVIEVTDKETGEPIIDEKTGKPKTKSIPIGVKITLNDSTWTRVKRNEAQCSDGVKRKLKDAEKWASESEANVFVKKDIGSWTKTTEGRAITDVIGRKTGEFEADKKTRYGSDEKLHKTMGHCVSLLDALHQGIMLAFQKQAERKAA
jgi:hypothetical protein